MSGTRIIIFDDLTDEEKLEHFSKILDTLDTIIGVVSYLEEIFGVANMLIELNSEATDEMAELISVCVEMQGKLILDDSIENRTIN